MTRLLVTGAVGQIGSELTMVLREKYGNDNVVATGRKTAPSEKLLNSGPFEYADCTDFEKLKSVIQKYKIDKATFIRSLIIFYSIDKNNKNL